LAEKIHFDDTSVAFRAKTNRELRRAYYLFRMLNYPWLVEVGKALTRLAFFLRLPIKPLIRATVFDHFCGGETMEECEQTLGQLRELGVEVILDYSIEGDVTREVLDATQKVALDIIGHAKSIPGIPFTVFKPSGQIRFALLEKIQMGDALTVDEQAEWDRARMRVEAVAAKSAKLNIPLLIDAEESWIQTAADELVRELMLKFNRERAIVYNTMQMYRHDRLDYLKRLYEDGVANNFHVGIKIVRGAYMEKERDRARELNYTDPIQKTKADTDRDFNDAFRFILERLDQMAIVAGTHNEQSCQLGVDMMDELSIEKTDPRVYFSQLYGMSDHISFNLADRGYNVVKYLPFGPVRFVMPYLFRRAEENTSVEGQAGRELTLLTREWKRRKGA
jgi:proline dehydrogenase